MKAPNITACYLIRIAGIGLCLAFAAWIANSIVRPPLSSLFSSPGLGTALFDVIFGVFALAACVAFVWLAWRVWRSWNATTVRWFIGIWTAILLVWIATLPMNWIADPTSRVANMITSVLAVPLIIFGAIAFRYMSHRLIRIAGLDEVLDIYGQPPGHQKRIRAFAGVLGWAIFLAGVSIDQWGDFSKHRIRGVQESRL